MRRICEGLLGPCSGISAWMCSWGRWDAEIPVLWDVPHVLRRPRGDSLRHAAVCREVINQDCCRHPLGSGSQIGWSFPRLLPLIFPLEWGEKKPFSLIIHSSWCTAFFLSQKYFPALPHTLQPYSPTASARVVVRCSLSSLEAWGIGSRANGSRRKLFSFPDISIFSYKAQATRCFRWGHLFVWNTTAHTCLLAGVGAQVSCGVRFAQPSEMHFVIPLGTSCKFPHVGTC